MAEAGKRVLVTSNGDLISKGIAFHLVKCGCRVVLMGDPVSLRNIAEEINNSLKVHDSVEVVGLEMREDKEAIFDQSVDKAWKLLDHWILLLTATTMKDEFKKMVKVNFMAAWYLLKAVSKRMRDSKSGGSIVFVSSILVQNGGYTQGLLYMLHVWAPCSSLVRASAMELGKHQIRVNGIARGENREVDQEVMPLLRWLDPLNDLASTVIYLVSDGSRFMTGTTIFVDGAQSIVRPRMRSYM
ncbi:unnamed protein product [Spirodela intermedia]|uniref:Uncharacterized protein n=1 Tax=Spirodela intermedia TaxID=51605 RepID=A0A7I8J3W5_SPIIN|nr:unnamed protein product [Spirodela intermedia]CAA6664050.1 unnamed protein product [Spirodela intermedia]